MINGITWLLVMQLVGEVLVRAAGLPVPGAVVGMLLLLLALVVRRPRADAGVLRVADGMLKHLQLFFIPAGVGVVVYLSVLREDALPIGVAMLGSWAVALLVVGWLVQFWVTRAARRVGPGHADPDLDHGGEAA